MKILLTIFLKITYYVDEVIFVLMMLLLVLAAIQNGAHHICGGGHWRKKNNVDKDNLDEPDDGIQINQNWIWKETDEVEEDDDKTITIITEHLGLK